MSSLRAAAPLALVLLLGSSPRALFAQDSASGSTPTGIAPVLEQVASGNGVNLTSERQGVDDAIRAAMVLEGQGNVAGALDDLRAAVQQTNFTDAKARYFLAREYRLEASQLATSDPTKAAEDTRMELYHLRGTVADAATSTFAEDKGWSSAAADQLAAHSSSTPLLDQDTAGGTYPWAYCGITSLRMVLQLENLPDPGADAVALQGAAPYTPGAGSDGGKLAVRAQQLGLTGAQFSETAGLSDIAASVANGRPVMVAGEGPYSAVEADGTVHARSYDDGHWLVVVGVQRDASGQVTQVIVNNPDGGTRETMTVDAFHTFFGADGSVWDVTYGL